VVEDRNSVPQKCNVAIRHAVGCAAISVGHTNFWTDSLMVPKLDLVAARLLALFDRSPSKRRLCCHDRSVPVLPGHVNSSILSCKRLTGSLGAHHGKFLLAWIAYVDFCASCASSSKTARIRASGRPFATLHARPSSAWQVRCSSPSLISNRGSKMRPRTTRGRTSANRAKL